MSDDLILYYHPMTRAATSIWMLEEVGRPYEVRYVDLKAGEHRTSRFLSMNPMGKIPTLQHGDTVVTESAAIGLYLADRFSLGTLAPEPSDPARGPYLRWSLFAPSVIEPSAAANSSDAKYEPTRVGWGSHENVLTSIEHAIGDGPYLLGDRFTMADVIFGATVRFMLQFGMVEKRERFTSYAERLSKRPASQKAAEYHATVIKERGLA